MSVDTSIYGLHQRILSKINIAQASMNDWQSLYKVIYTVVYTSLLHFHNTQCAYNGIYIGDICNSLPKTIQIFKRVCVAPSHAHIDVMLVGHRSLR